MEGAACRHLGHISEVRRRHIAGQYEGVQAADFEESSAKGKI
jgi:hypothetical protein